MHHTPSSPPDARDLRRLIPERPAAFGWADVNWKALQRLRARFLQFDPRGSSSEAAAQSLAERPDFRAAPGPPVQPAPPPNADYWRTHSELASYDFTFARRIGWKWETVLAELKARGWEPGGDTADDTADNTADGWHVLDWGCGTGIAGRLVAAAWPGKVRRLAFCDRSAPARRFAAERAREELGAAADAPLIEALSPEAAADQWGQAAPAGPPQSPTPNPTPGHTPRLLVVSHVLNELAPDALEALLALAARADALLWVEPGAAPVSRRLLAVRDRLLGLAQDQSALSLSADLSSSKANAPRRFHVVAPCPGHAPCGLHTPGNERHWCHQFARVPGPIHTDPGWGRFSQTLNIDLARLPMSFLVLERQHAAVRPAMPPTPSPAAEPIAEPAAPVPGEAPAPTRLIGEPRFHKGHARLLCCRAEGVRELILQKRDLPEAFKALKKAPGTLYHWQLNEAKIIAGGQVF